MGGPSIARPGTRILQLDLLRALAVTLVLGRHMAPQTVFPSQTVEHIEPIWLRSVLETWQRGGWVGVDLFFVLSGFLVSGLLFSEQIEKGSLDVRRFLFRRAFKIYPAYYVLIVVAVGLGVATGAKFSVTKTAAVAAFLQNYFTEARVWKGLAGHCWSLCVEEHFYILLPLSLLMLKRTFGHLRGVPIVVALGAALALFMRLANADRPFSFTVHLIPTHIRLDSLLFGVLLGYWAHYQAERFAAVCHELRWALIAGGVALLSPAFVYELKDTPFLYTYGYTLFYVGSGMLLCGLLHVRVPQNRITRVVAAFGAHSYSIYLWHWPVLVAFVSWSKLAPERIIPCYFGVAIAVGLLMGKLIEWPALRFRDRLFPAVRGAMSSPDPRSERPRWAESKA
jgi:peptidoglycan/LPS O-acetylase OafA/YrhL